MAQKNSRFSLVKKITVIAAALIIFQVGYLIVMRKQAPPPTRERIEQSVSKVQGIDNDRRAKLKVQLALNDFRVKHKGQLPKDLKELTPEYFDVIPTDPTTGKPFEYHVDGKSFTVGIGKDKAGAAAGSPDSEGAPGANGEMTDQEKQALIASLDENATTEKYVYDPSQRTDPFRPFDFSPDLDTDSDKTPLEQLDTTQLRMTAVIASAGDPMALIEDAEGHGYSVKKGTKVGRRGGEVVEVRGDRIIIVETEIDFTGEKHEKVVEIQMQSAPSRYGR